LVFSYPSIIILGCSLLGLVGLISAGFWNSIENKRQKRKGGIVKYW
jgi:hypothetical protein